MCPESPQDSVPRAWVRVCPDIVSRSSHPISSLTALRSLTCLCVGVCVTSIPPRFPIPCEYMRTIQPHQSCTSKLLRRSPVALPSVLARLRAAHPLPLVCPSRLQWNACTSRCARPRPHLLTKESLHTGCAIEDPRDERADNNPADAIHTRPTPTPTQRHRHSQTSHNASPISAARTRSNSTSL